MDQREARCFVYSPQISHETALIGDTSQRPERTLRGWIFDEVLFFYDRKTFRTAVITEHTMLINLNDIITSICTRLMSIPRAVLNSGPSSRKVFHTLSLVSTFEMASARQIMFLACHIITVIKTGVLCTVGAA